ncbi:unnamed protein product [Callosobruchus maculatus]|uniref:Uncharacterized protein n=1 Tax=Callosobruchus maculatus TaxID=64391 RepID=A0A653DVD7_CALMS|nr:unnamed protein product [Callosobruchus maculatus]
MFNPIEDFAYLLNNVILGETTIEDVILLVGTLVAFIALILWCCFPVPQKDTLMASQIPNKRSSKYEEKYNQLMTDYDISGT